MAPLRTIYLSGLGTGNPTGLPDEHSKNPGIDFSVSPNPFNDRLLISYELPRTDQISIEIRDITGKLLYHSDRPARGRETVEIIWSSMPGTLQGATGGIYLLSLRKIGRAHV